jgi:hypothetical protein
MDGMEGYMTGYRLYNETKFDDSPAWELLPQSAKEQWERNAIEYTMKVARDVMEEHSDALSRLAASDA